MEISREEAELISYFRGLPVQQQLELLSAAESHYNSFERMKELACRQGDSGLTDSAGWN